MSYTKTIVCLANSRKISGRCIAGKEITDAGYGEWIRPVSSRPTGEISEYERRFEDGEHPQTLDVITIPLVKHHPHHYQQENHLIDDGYYWEKERTIGWGELGSIADNVPNEIWVNGYSSYNGTNDRIPEDVANSLENSLLLVQPDTLAISVSVEGAEFGDGKRKVRAIFSLNGHQYKLAVTDPKIESIYLKKEDGRYNIDASKVYMCVSIGEPYNEYCYKLVASIIYE
jgi:hypothetical protein